MLLIFLIPELLLLFFHTQDSLNSFPFKTFDFAGECVLASENGLCWRVPLASAERNAGECRWRGQLFCAGGEKRKSGIKLFKQDGT